MKNCKMKSSKFTKLRSQKGVTLVEILLAAGILGVVLVGQLKLFIVCSGLSNISGNLTVATAAAQSKLEEIRGHEYSDIVTDYSGATFDLTDLTGKGVVYVDSSNPDLLEIEVVVSWEEEKSKRVIGEDTDLDGVLDGGEDTNFNGRLDSIVAISSWLADRT